MRRINTIIISSIFTISLLACDTDNRGASLENDEATESTSSAKTVLATKNTRMSDWPSYGRSAAEQRHSPLSKISTENVSDLGAAWVAQLDTKRSIEATPVVIDGIMYTTGSWGVTYALNAKTGEQIWMYDPKVPKAKARHACCDVNNRGVAVHGDKVFVGAFDGRLIALDKANGKPLWVTATFDPELPYSITGAPRVVKNKVIIGNGGADYGVRGFVAAYDVDTGKRLWQFFTVPGNPADGFENATMEKAAETWTGEWWRLGGGGTVWDSMAFDAELDLLYIGVGNGAPWNRKVRSPAGGDNLFLSSIFALRPDTGEYVWHYQTTPGDSWDYTATQSIILGERMIDGVQRKILMQAPKNGFFYVLDRTNGELISAEPFVTTTWATHVDMQTGRPVETPDARYPAGKLVWAMPSPFGGHNWHPMSYNPDLGLAFIPAQELPFPFMDFIDDELARVDLDSMNTNVALAPGDLPDTKAERDALLKGVSKGFLQAWDPVTQKEVWRVQHDRMGNGGTLSTAGNLVFQGNSRHELLAVDARNGKVLWSQQVNGEMLGGPISYEVDGEQYIAVSAGWGSILHLFSGAIVGQRAGPQFGQVIAFKLGADLELDLTYAELPPVPKPPEETASAETVEMGRNFYNRFCVSCHGDSGIASGETPDLRYSASLGSQAFTLILQGGLEENGMPSFSGRLSDKEIAAIDAYIIRKAWAGYRDDLARAKVAEQNPK